METPFLKRGAQKGNRNALKHGLYSKDHPSPFLTSPAPSPTTSDGSLLDEQAIQLLRQRLLDYLLTSPDSHNLRTYLSWQRPIPKAIQSIERLTAASVKLQQADQQLRLLAAYPLQLIRWGFHQEGIDRDIALSPRTPASPDAGRSRETSESVSIHFRSPDIIPRSSRDCSSSGSVSTSVDSLDRPSTFLTTDQWAIIAPLLPQSEIVNRKSKIHPGRPASDPRPILDAILHKLAHHLAWNELTMPAPSPFSVLENGDCLRPECSYREGSGRVSTATIRRCYRRLYLSGRLYTLLKALYRHFQAHSGTTLLALLEQGTFTSNGRDLILSPAAPATWQTRTALLFLQLAGQNLRTLLHERDLQQYPRSPLFRYPSLPSFLHSPLLFGSPLGSSGPSDTSGASDTSDTFLHSFLQLPQKLDKIPLRPLEVPQIHPVGAGLRGVRQRDRP